MKATQYLGKNWFNLLPIACLVILVAMVLPICVALADFDDPDEAYGEYTDLQDQIKKEEQRLKEMEGVRRGALRELNDIDKDINYLNSRIENIENDLRIKKAQMSEYERQLGQAKADLTSAQERFERRLIEWYKAGTQQDVGFLLSAEDVTDFIYRLYYTRKILDEDKAIISEIRAQKSDLFEARDNLNLEIDKVKDLKYDLSGYRSDYHRLFGKKQEIVDDISSDVNAIEEAIEELEQESNDIASFLRGIEGNPYVGVIGMFDGTLMKPINASMGSGFGMRMHPILHRRKMHTGVDFPAPTGTNIKAAGGGQVVFCGWKSGYGKTIIIDHGNGLATLYAHCSQLLANSGEYVTEGQVIAKVGSTGFTTGPHLHFEVRKNGDPKDPMQYIH